MSKLESYIHKLYGTHYRCEAEIVPVRPSPCTLKGSMDWTDKQQQQHVQASVRTLHKTLENPPTAL